MCGFAGLVETGGFDRGAAEPRMKRALERLAPRGPDGEGIWSDGHCLLGHRRLAIVDLSPGGAQPMTRGSLTAVYNGMIYNFRALRRELEGMGERFASQSDTEVLLAGWARWGEGLLPKLVGMFAFAIWDGAARELILARDAFGKKPLFYRAGDGRLVFASELRALQRLDGEAGTIDPVSLRLYFALRYLPEPRSILAGVEKLAPGHLLRLTHDKHTVRRWYASEADRPEPYTSFEDAAADLRERIDEAVRDRLVADVPVGAYLSGGIDSAIIAAALVRSTDNVRTFTVGFEGVPGYYEERPQARLVAEHLGTEHTELSVGAAETRDVIAAVFDGLDEPFADSSAIPSYLIARETRRHVTVALSGDGADEVFGGYRKYQGELAAARYQSLPGWLRRAAIEPIVSALPEGKGGWLRERFRRARRFAEHGGKDAVGRQAGWARSLSEAELDALLARKTQAPSLDCLIAQLRETASEADPVNAMLAADIALVLPGDMLVKVDRMSMANGLEVRCPYLDRRVVECAAAMPGEFKLTRSTGKRILREAFADRLPADVFARPKKGFEVPIAEWLTGPLSDLVADAIDPARLRRQGLIRPELPARWLTELKSGRRDTSWQLWSVIAFQQWCDRQDNVLEAAAA